MKIWLVLMQYIPVAQSVNQNNTKEEEVVITESAEVGDIMNDIPLSRVVVTVENSKVEKCHWAIEKIMMEVVIAILFFGIFNLYRCSSNT